MASRQEAKLLAGVAPFLEPGERALGATVCQPRGRSPRVTALHVGITGQEHKAKAAAQDAEVELASRMGLAPTDRRMLTFVQARQESGAGAASPDETSPDPTQVAVAA